MTSSIRTIGPRFVVAATVLLILAVGPAGAQDEGQISVSDYGVGTEVVDRELKGKSDRFEEGTQVVFWTRVVGGQSGDRIRHVWFRDTEEVVSIGLTLGGPHWRVYTRKTMHPGSGGQWAVEARDAEDRVLARAEFTCEPAGSQGEETGQSP